MKFLLLSLLFLTFVSCVTDQNVAKLAGETDTTKTVPADVGNQAFSFNPTSYNFGNRAVGSAPITTTVLITNSSSQTVFLSSIAGLSGAFTLVSDNCPRAPSDIAKGQTCSAIVSFSPTAGVSYNSSLTMIYGTSSGNTTAYTATMGLSGTGVGSLTFAGIDSVSEIYATQVKLNWTHVVGATAYYIFKVNGDNSLTYINNVTAPTATYIVSGLTASTTYKFWVRALDAIGLLEANTNVVTTATNTTPAAPVLTGQQNYTFTSNNAIALGSALSMNFDDFRTGSATDSGITYSCSYDQVVDSSVTTSGNCSSLPSGASFSTTSGALSWTPLTQGAIGFYEFKIIVTDNISALFDTEYFYVDIRPAYLTTNLVGNYSAMFSSGINSQTTETSWQDLTTGNFDGTLTNFVFGGAYGWKGSGTIASPYRVVFDGTNNYVDLGNVGLSSDDLTLESWYYPSLISSTPSSVILSNADSSAKGLMIREAKGYRNRIETVVGNKSYADEVLSDNPVSYLRLGETSGSAIYDIGMSPSAWTISSLQGYEKTSPISNNTDKCVQFNGTSSNIVSGLTINPAAWSGITYEAWINFSNFPGTHNTLFSHSNQNAITANFWLWYDNSFPGIRMQIADGASQLFANYSITPAFGTWYHVAATINFTTRVYNLYLNGVNVKNSTFTGLVYNNMANPKITLAAYYSGSDKFSGYMDEVAVYNTDLSAARVLAHYNAKSNLYSCVSNVIDQSKWNHVASTFNNTTQSLSLFANGNLDCAVSTSGITLSGTTAQTALGARVTSVNNPVAGTYLNGNIADARIYSTALSTTQIRSNLMSQADQFDIPNSVAGLNLWLKADSITGLNDGDVVTTWNDSSTAGRSASQATPGFKPTYRTNVTNGKPTVRFDGVDDQMNISGTNNSWTVFAVYKINGTEVGMMHVLTGTNFLGYLTSIPSGTTHSQWYMAAPNWASYQTVTANLGTTNFHISTYIGDVVNAKAYTDGTLGYSNTGTMTAGYLNCLANYSCADTRFFNGDIAEVLAYSGTLTEVERIRIEGYLKAKYNL